MDLGLGTDEEILHDVHPSWMKWAKILLLTVGFAAPYVWWVRRKTRYVVTTERVIKASGAFSTSTNEYSIDDISNIQTHASLGERLRGYGTIVIDTPSEAIIRFEAVPNYTEIANTIRQHQ